jgi:EAL domain-containing protein (putative c-di-GMP-specific phosphodiesterase class I)
VNVPATVADSVHWAQSVADRAEAAGVDPGRLVIEITEDGGERCNRTLVGAITQLRLRGFSCAIDDFGSGDSSLDRLLRVPFSELKINRDMIQQARNHPHARSILASTIAMGKQLVATVVAEGIEDDEDLEMVRSLGCQVTQGYLHAKPLCRAAYARYCTRFNN